jgi:endonuclease/exonuclease/phosphatase family metal-dependent hydrolase
MLFARRRKAWYGGGAMRGTLPAVGLCLWLLVLLSCAGAPPRLEQAPAAAEQAAELRPWEAPGEIEVLSWNLGFGGLGEGAEFYPDGGRRFIPSSRRDVLRNARGIADYLAQAAADVLLLQEAARPSAVNHRVDLLAAVEQSLPGRWRAWSPDVTLSFPRISVGLAIFAAGPPRRVERLELPGERRQQRYHLLVARFPLQGRSGELVLADLHLSAFDPKAGLRHRQLEAVTDFALAEYGRGNHVVLGGDWNLLLAETRFAHTTEERYLFWLHTLPDGFPPPGWRLAVDDQAPSVRTLERPYRPGENYTAVIDGFLASPNVTVLEVRTGELGFRFSDHQPVAARLRLD